VKTIASLFLSTCFLFLTTTKCSLASHALGGEITYTHVQGLTYQINITYYSHIPSPQNGSVDRPTLDSVHVGEGVIMTFSRDSFVDYPDDDIRVNYYSEVRTFWTTGVHQIYFVDPNRAGNIANIPNSFYIPFAIEAELTISGLCPNSSVRFGDKPIFFAQHNKPYAQNVTAINIDHDSISFELVPCLGENLQPIPGYEFPRNFSIDSISGLITSNGNPDTICKWAFAVKISDWKNGILAGYVIRDYTLEILPDTDATYFFSPPANTLSLTGPVGLPVNSSFYFVDNSGAGVSVFGEAFASNNSAITVFTNGISDTVFQNTTWTPDFFRPRSSPYIFVYRGGSNKRQADFTLLVYVTGIEYDSCYSPPPIGVPEDLEDENTLQIFPNPVQDQLHITLNNSELKNCKVAMYDVMGKEVLREWFSGSEILLSVNAIPPGIYLLHVENDGRQYFSKISIVHR